MKSTDFITRMIENKYPTKTVGKIEPIFNRCLFDSNGFFDMTNDKNELLFGRLSINTYCFGNTSGYNADFGIMDTLTQIPGDELVQAEAYEDQGFTIGKITHANNYEDILFNQLYFNLTNANIKMYFCGYKLTLIDK